MSFIEIIRDRYSSMSDEQLRILYEHEIAELTTEARSLLIKELDKRGINPVNDDNADDSFHLPSVNSIQQLTPEIRFFITECLERGYNLGYITGGLLERGLTEQEVEETIDMLPDFYQKESKKNSDALLRSIFFSTAGFAIKSLPLNAENHLALITFSYLIIFFGGLSFFHQILLKKRLQKISKSILAFSNKVK